MLCFHDGLSLCLEYAEESINSYGSDSVTDKQSKVEYSFEYNDYDYYKIVVKYKKDNSTSTYSQTLYIKVSQTNHQPSQVSEHQFNNLKNSSNANK